MLTIDDLEDFSSSQLLVVSAKKTPQLATIDEFFCLLLSRMSKSFQNVKVSKKKSRDHMEELWLTSNKSRPIFLQKQFNDKNM